MATLNLLDPAIDISGSYYQTDSMDLSDESSMLGRILQDGYGFNISVSGPTVTITGLSGMQSCSVGNYITLSGNSNINNNGTFLITGFTDASTVTISNPLAVDDSGFDWQERKPYTLEDDLNYIRTDRAAMKGVAYDQPIPTYFRCNNQLVPVPANLLNIAGKTTDAKSFVLNRKIDNVDVNDGDGYITIYSTGNLKHADAIDLTGVPINDGYDAGYDEATFANITDGYNNSLYVLNGIYKDWIIYGRTRAGSSIPPDEVEVEFRAVELGADLSTSVDYIWEAGQSNIIDIYYGYRQCLYNISDTAFRTLISSTARSGVILPEPNGVGQVLFAIENNRFRVAMPVTSTQGWLVNEDGILLINEVYLDGSA